jgi:hypothetical protein
VISLEDKAFLCYKDLDITHGKGRNEQMTELHVSEDILHQALSALVCYLQSRKVTLREEHEQQIRLAWEKGIETTLELGKYELEIIPPRKSGDNVVRIHEEGDFAGSATKVANELIYSATELNWYEEEKNRATL